MITANYEFSNTPAANRRAAPSRSAYRRPVAMVVGEVRGVPFRNVFKSYTVAERVARSVHGAQLIAF